ncbi:MAG: toxin-antitoxin system YwqK family antitoxin [Saprospiraceae bacterium]|nr:toxin-antitoxin system YwqK family antitoxin [Bacteroidia bacterium]NNL93637.1 toxin-antitoxin system YwqK family antitoxin [Saprospiraceae bacterium]
MRNILLFLVLGTFGSACKQNIVKIESENGNVIEEYEVSENQVKNGAYKRFFESGEIQETATYVNGKLEGERIIYHKNGKPEIREFYKDDVLEGDYFSYYENGQIEISSKYSNGVMNGPLTKYYENGKVQEKVQMVDNTENGPFKEYFENGQIHWEGQYLNGDNEFGLLKEYDENGQLLKKMMCDSLAVCRTIWTMKDGDIKPKY